MRQYPAIFRGGGGEETGGGRKAVELPSEGGRCFTHTDAPAATVCEGCGRFMCEVCDTIWNGEHLCLSCIHDRRDVKREEGFVSRRIIYDNAALGILAIPIIFFYPFFWLGVVTGPMGMYYLVRYRKEPRGFVPRSRFRMVLAWVLSLGTILGGLGLIGLIIYAIIEGMATAPPAE